MLFASGRDKLKDEGKEILDTVARIINGDNLEPAEHEGVRMDRRGYARDRASQ